MTEQSTSSCSCIGGFLFLSECAVSDAGSSLSDRIYADLIITIKHGAVPYGAPTDIVSAVFWRSLYGQLVTPGAGRDEEICKAIDEHQSSDVVKMKRLPPQRPHGAVRCTLPAPAQSGPKNVVSSKINSAPLYLEARRQPPSSNDVITS